MVFNNVLDFKSLSELITRGVAIESEESFLVRSLNKEGLHSWHECSTYMLNGLDKSDWEIMPTWSTEDLYEKIPKTISVEGLEYRLIIDPEYNSFKYYNAKEDRAVILFFSDSILIGLYELLLWALDKGYVNAAEI